MYIMPFDPRLDAPRAASTPPGETDDSVRRTILDAASEAFADKGYAATKVATIAELAGLPKSNVHYYFKSKENIYAKVLEDIAPSYLDACMPVTDADETPIEALTQTLLRMIRLFERQPFAAKVFMAELREGARRLPGEFFTRWTVQTQKSLADIRQWVDRGLLAPVTPEHALLTIWAMAQSCVSRGWQMPGLSGESMDYDAAASNAARLLLGGLMPRL
ncbi:TetR/AcrR family transcriptional regulator [Pseudomonas japonica]|uniref:Transcriptional regulator, TetR family n=1 Tax=Pseudomonas japonica TaxID=256466 RepID=A0A239EBN6_9PSED|nr:TetR/AcrR family transcriptional regulator [Pseudomonas japonica]SNS42017.1 transcriptional regulator, TetR family [Pseudomonas japonica]